MRYYVKSEIQTAVAALRLELTKERVLILEARQATMLSEGGGSIAPT